MTYAVSSALQSAVFGAVSSNSALQALIGGDVFDQPPSGVLPLTYVVVGEEDVQARSDISANGAVHDLTISVFSDAAGFSAAKAVAVTISDALVDVPLALTRGRLVSMSFLRARARRGKAPDGRRIDLTFRARVEDI